MPDSAQLAALVAVHRRRSFDLAAAELHVTPSAVSQRIKALEEAAGTVLIHRGQPCSATPAGLRLIRHHDEVALLERQLAADLPGLVAGPASLRIAVNADSLATWLIPAMAATPGILYDLVIDDQDVSQEWLKRGEVSGAITAHPGPLQGCQTIPLGQLRYRATASPAFFHHWFETGVHLATIARAPGMTFWQKDRLQEHWVRRYIAGTGSRVSFPSHHIASPQAFVDATLAGLGWSMNPEPLVAPHLAAGRLVEILPDTPLDVPLHWQFTRLSAPALKPLTAALQHAAASVLIAPD